MYDEGQFALLPTVIDRLSQLLLWETWSVSTRLRRATARLRVCAYDPALQDVEDARTLAQLSDDPALLQPDILRLRAWLYQQIQSVASLECDLFVVVWA